MKPVSSKLGKFRAFGLASPCSRISPSCCSTRPDGLTTLHLNDCCNPRTSNSAVQRFATVKSGQGKRRQGIAHSRISNSSAWSNNGQTFLHQARSFSSAPSRMAGTKIDGTAIAKDIRERLNAQIAQAQESNPRFKPSLKIIQGMKSVYRDIGSLVT